MKEGRQCRQPYLAQRNIKIQANAPDFLVKLGAFVFFPHTPILSRTLMNGILLMHNAKFNKYNSFKIREVYPFVEKGLIKLDIENILRKEGIMMFKRVCLCEKNIRKEERI